MKLHNYDTFSKPVFVLSIANPFTSNALPEWNALSLEFVQVNSVLLVFCRNHRELSWWIINCWCELAILFIHNLKDILFRFKTRFAMGWQRRRWRWRQQRHDANCCASLPFEMIALNGNFRWCENGKMRKFKLTKIVFCIKWKWDLIIFDKADMSAISNNGEWFWIYGFWGIILKWYIFRWNTLRSLASLERWFVAEIFIKNW